MASSMPLHPFVTTFLVANIHCPTCVSSIKDALQRLDGVRWVSPNIITSCVAVDHDPAIPIMQMVSELEAAGFEVSSVSSEKGVDSLDIPISKDAQSFNNFDGAQDYATRLRRFTHPQEASVGDVRVNAHLNNCQQCREERASGNPAITGATLDTDRKRSGPSTSKRNLTRAATASSPSSAAADDGANTPRSWRATLAISGMTCAACSNGITNELEKKDWVIKAIVNLVTNSAVIDYLGAKEDVSQVVESIEDLGYDAHIDQVNATNDEREKEMLHQRSVQIRIDDFYCPHCGGRVASSVAGFQRDIQIDSHPTWQRPILEVTYSPQAPDFTIRHILAAIEASDPAFKASIYHPPTLEERAKTI
ncbi:hypothetical protein NUW58_g5592 [Xylaria curta]|uniref:Uncharacterized protein n=1 Tax=Xylaria curta TaxID=42375 RepID=A0ACC1P3D1_9PEZI|nr:hypothetical protein NUW58_g5592 [Xylaria curta]